MKYEITIPFCFDTTAIEQCLQEIGQKELEKAIAEIVEKNVRDCLPKKLGYGLTMPDVPDWRGYLDEKLRAWLDEHAEEVVDEAALLMAEKGGRKRRWRDVLKDIKEEQ